MKILEVTVQDFLIIYWNLRIWRIGISVKLTPSSQKHRQVLYNILSSPDEVLKPCFNCCEKHVLTWEYRLSESAAVPPVLFWLTSYSKSLMSLLLMCQFGFEVRFVMAWCFLSLHQSNIVIPARMIITNMAITIYKAWMVIFFATTDEWKWINARNFLSNGHFTWILWSKWPTPNH